MKTQLQAAAGAKAAGRDGSKKPLSPRSVAKILILGGSAWRYGRRIKMVDGSPFADVRKPRAAKREPYILDAGEIAKLRAALDVPFERLLIELTLTTGMRSGEVRGLTWDSIDLEGKRPFIERQANRPRPGVPGRTECPGRAEPDRRRYPATPHPAAGAAQGGTAAAQVSRPAPHGRHPHARGRRTPQARPGNSRACLRANHARDLHAQHAPHAR
jgi:Phage integrase family